MESLELDGMCLGIDRCNAISERLLKEVPRVRLEEAVLHEDVLGLGAVDKELEGGGGGQALGDELREVGGL